MAVGKRRHFVVFFDEKEGTTAMIRLLDNFPQVDVLRARGEWEPFDRHCCGPMPLSSLRDCLDLIFSGAPIDEVNRIYQRTATRALSKIRPDRSIGFKMRFKAPLEPRVPSAAQVFPGLGRWIGNTSDARFKRTMIEVLRRHDVLVFLAVRQDLLRWGLSKYHGDGTGRPGHLQFRLARGELAREQIPRMAVDPVALGRTIDACEEIHAAKRRLGTELTRAGLEVVPMRYEDFLADGVGFFEDVLGRLGHEVSEREIDEALDRGVRLERVHGDDLSEFFLNAEELEDRFGDRFARWTQ